MKKLFTIIICVCFASQARSQYVDYEHPTYPIDSFTFYDSGYYQTYDTFVEYQNTVPQMISFAKAFYNSGPIIYMKLDEQDYSSCHFKVIDSSGSSSSLVLSNYELIISGLPKDKPYLVYVINEVGDTIPIHSFRTNRNIDPDVLETSRSLFDSMRVWVNNDTNQLSTYIRNLVGVHNLEKISLLQQFYMDSLSLIPDIYITGYLIPDYTIFNKKPTCNCKMAMTATNKFATSPGILVDGSIWGEETTETAKTDKGVWQDLLWANVAAQGPSKMAKVDFKGQGGTTDQKYPFVAQTNGGSPYYAQRIIGYFCTDNNEYSSDCGCTRTINVKYLYQSKMTAHASTSWCATCLGRYATSQVDDLAYVTAYNDQTEVMTYIDGEARQAYAKNKENINKEFVLEFLDAQFDFGVPLAISLGLTSATGFPVITPGLIDSMKSYLQALVNLPPPYLSTDEANGLIYFNSINGQTNFSIEPGAALVVTMGSYHKSYFTGKGQWESNTTIASDFMLSLRHKGGWNGPEEDCCGPNLGSWVLSTQQGKAPSSYAQLQGLVSDHLGAIIGWWSSPNIGIDYGTLVGDPGWRCYTEVQGLIAPVNKDLDVKIAESKLFVQLLDSGELKELEGESFEIVDITGKLLTSGKVGVKGYLTDLYLGFPTLIILRVYTDGTVYNKKLGLYYSPH
ncbi:MAG TPA: hypothetical protein DIW47_10740 [Bacteroidetes bacterium]|nr:hypothetical protein [Bacteroidota bacterium]